VALASNNAYLDNECQGEGMSLWRPKTWLGIVIATALGLAAAYGVYLIIWLTSDREAIAEADRLDPAWRMQELQDKREVIPNQENGALVVLAACKLWPVQQTPYSQEFWALDGGTEQSIILLPPPMELNGKQQAALKNELQKAAPALKEARRLLHVSRGRYPSTESLEAGGGDYQESRRIAKLLHLDSVLQAQEKQEDEALATPVAIVNAGRSIGDEPSIFAQMVRMSCQMALIAQIERVLAQGEPGENALQAAQQRLENEANQPLLLIGVRGDRAQCFQNLERMDNLFWHGYLREAFRMQTKCVEAAKAPSEKQLVAARKLKSEASSLNPVTLLWFFSFEEFLKNSLRNQAWLRCTYVGLAAERYRLAHNRWPDALAALVPEFIHEVPVDPYNGSPLKYRRLDDGVVIYSVGPDDQDNGGKLDRQNPTAPGTDIGFQPWDVPHRRQPWRPLPQKAEGDEKKQEQNGKNE
jgi:hypothetical protein